MMLKRPYVWIYNPTSLFATAPAHARSLVENARASEPSRISIPPSAPAAVQGSTSTDFTPLGTNAQPLPLNPESCRPSARYRGLAPGCCTAASSSQAADASFTASDKPSSTSWGSPVAARVGTLPRAHQILPALTTSTEQAFVFRSRAKVAHASSCRCSSDRPSVIPNTCVPPCTSCLSARTPFLDSLSRLSSEGIAKQAAASTAPMVSVLT
mmetsp:Transcript_34563/g.66043  ORF Transcript_34563/g.66043 Transcript_34563/m.66043 type:complete len:212 (-) Transcript_34563:461-1096(-)